MKLNPNKPALLLDFTKLKGSAREALASKLQEFLILKLGFHWESDKNRTRPLHLKADAIIVNSGDGCPVSLAHIRQGELQSRPQKNTRYFDVTTEHDEFLDTLQELVNGAINDTFDPLISALEELLKKIQSNSGEKQETPDFSRV